MIICVCHRVSDRDIAHAARAGCASFEALQEDLCVATACGVCGDCARETFEKHARDAASIIHAASPPAHEKPVRIVAALRRDALPTPAT